MKSEQEKKPHPFPEMVAIWKANREHCTAAAVIEDGEVVSGMMPGDDYKLTWISADGWDSARNFMPPITKKKLEGNKCLPSNSPMHPLLRY